MKKRKTAFQRVFSALQEIHKSLEKEVKTTHERFQSEYAYGFSAGKHRQAKDTLTIVKNIMLKM